MKTVKMNVPTLFVIVAVGCSAPFLVGLQTTNSGDPIQVISVAQPKCAWKQVASIADANDAPDGADLLFTDMVTVTTVERKTVYTAADPNFVVWKVPTDVRNAQFSFLTTTDADSHVIAVYRCDGPTILNSAPAGGSDLEDSFYLAMTWTLTGGTMTGPGTLVYCDTASVVDATLVSIVEDSAANRRVTISVNLEGVDALAFVGTTVHTAKTVKVLARWGN